MRNQQADIQIELLNNGWEKNNRNVWIKPEQSNKESISWPVDSYEKNSYKENFWSRARADLIIKTFDDLKIEALLEIGSGHGNVSIPLMKAGLEVIALEPILGGAEQTAEWGLMTIHGSLHSIEKLELAFPAIGIFDLLEHIKNPIAFITNMREKLNTGGIIVLTVPAHNWLFSDFDNAIGHYKRYTKNILRNEMREAGFQEISSRYFFVTLVFPAFLFRRLPYIFGRKRSYSGEGGIKQDIKKTTNVYQSFDAFLYRILKIESQLRFPIGLSLLGVYQKI